MREFRTAARKLVQTYMDRPGAGVTSVYVGYKVTGGRNTGRLAVVVGVEKKRPVAELTPDVVIPSQVDGIATDVVETGRYRALGVVAAPQATMPTVGGSSVGHYSGPTGTLGAWVKSRDGQPVLLSNAHVIAATRDGQPGDAVLSPGPVDGGRDPEDRIARLAAVVPILPQFQGTNVVDVALATPEDSRFVTPEIAGIGVVTGVADAVLGETVYKSGRTTGVTSGTVAGTDATVDVWYDGFVARFVSQYVVQPGTFSASSGRPALCGVGTRYDCESDGLGSGADWYRSGTLAPRTAAC